MSDRARASAVWAPFAVGALVFLLQLPIFDRWMSLMDEGHILQFADLLRRGGELYRDATLIAFPGAFYLLAWLFELFEPSVRVARYAVAIEFALLVSLVFVLLRGWVQGRAVALALALLGLYRIWVFPHWQMYSYSTTALAFIAASLVLCVGHLVREGEERWRLALAGGLAGIAVACKQDYGGAAVIALNLAMIVAARTAPGPPPAPLLRRLALFNGAGLAVGVVMLGHYAWQGLLPEMLRQTLLNHLVGIATFEYSSLPPLLPLFAQEPEIRSTYGFAVYVPAIVFSMDWPRVSASFLYQETFLWDLGIKTLFWGPYAYVTAALVRVAWRHRALRDPDAREGALRELTLVLLAALLVYTLHKPKDWVHMVVMYWPLLCLAAVHADALQRARPALARFTGAVLALPALTLVGYTLFLGAQLRERHDTPLAGERAGGLHVTADEAHVIGGAVDYLRERSAPGSRVAVLPYFPLVNFLTERDGPHRSTYILWPLEEVPGREAQIAAELDANPEQPVLYHFTQWIQFPGMQEFAPELFAHLVEHYEVERVFTDDGWGYMLAGLRRSSDARPGRPLLRDDVAGAGLFRETAEGERQPVGAAARGEWVARQVWPFRPALALRPRAGGERSILATPLHVEPGDRLETAIGVHPRRWFKFPPSTVRFAIAIVSGGQRETLYERTLDPHPNGEERGWFPVSLPLDAWAGRDVEIELSTEVERDNSEVFEMGGFAWPRVVGGAPPVAGSAPEGPP